MFEEELVLTADMQAFKFYNKCGDYVTVNYFTSDGGIDDVIKKFSKFLESATYNDQVIKRAMLEYAQE